MHEFEGKWGDIRAGVVDIVDVVGVVDAVIDGFTDGN